MADGPKFVVAALPVRTSVDMRAEYAALCSRIIPRFHPGSFDDQAAIKAELLKAGLLSVEGFAAWDAREWPDKIAVVKILLERRETGEKPADEPRSDEPVTPLQANILEALAGRALKVDLLAGACNVDASRLYKPGGLKELSAAGRVKLKRQLGYYRPDAPPIGKQFGKN